MDFSNLLDALQNLTKTRIRKKEIAALFGWETPNYIRREKEKRALAMYELELVANYYKINVNDLINYTDNNVEVEMPEKEEPIYTDNPECTCRHCETCTKCILCGKNRDKVEIHYWEGCTDTWKHSKLTLLNFDREMVEDIWGREPENLRIVAMTGDKMDGGSYPFKNRDILLIDMSANSVEKTGAFLFTTRGGEGIYICNLDQKLNGDVVFSHNNPLFEETRYTKEQLRELDFKVIGRVFKNESYNL